MYSCDYVQGWMAIQLYAYTVLVGYTVGYPAFGFNRRTLTPTQPINRNPSLSTLTTSITATLYRRITPKPNTPKKPKRTPDFQGI